MNWPESFRHHPNDHTWWYRFVRAFWIWGLTMAGVFSIVLTIWWLTEYGELTTTEAEALNIPLRVVSWGIAAGFAVAGINLLGPHRFQNIINSSTAAIIRRVRGWYHAE